MKRKLSEQQIIRREKISKLMSIDANPYSSTIAPTHFVNDLNNQFNELSKQDLAEKSHSCSIAGRIMGQRGPFILIMDKTGTIQTYFSKKEFPDLLKVVKLLDLGDIIWVQGSLMKTNTGELSIRINDLKLLTKSLSPLPEKYHKLKDVEERYRRRFVDLIVNESSRKILKTRVKIVKTIRTFFDELDYLEVDTPILEPILGGAAALPFTTHYNSLKRDFYLRVATELPLKKLIVGGMDRVYEIGRLFRNEGIDTTHNPEFTSIEFYEAYSDLAGMMKRTEELFKFIGNNLGLKTVTYGTNVYELNKAFKKIKMTDAIFQITKIDFEDKTMTLEKAKKLANEFEVHVEPFFKIGHIINAFFEKFVEDTLIQPTFITNHPIEISPLAALDPNDNRFVQRAELFINKREYANMFTELNDPIDQLKRFEDQAKEKDQGNKEANEIDYNYIEALEYGMPPTGGCGIGIDRLVMFFTNSQSIREVLIFPHMKSRK